VKGIIIWEVTGHGLVEVHQCFRVAGGAEQTEQKPMCFVEEGNILIWLMDSLHLVTVINYKTLL
jgi:hypothetical protein